MKILLTADLHGNRYWYEWLAGMAPHVDLIAIAGDLLHGIDAGAVPDQIPDVERWLGKIFGEGCAVAVCSGNHEMFLKRCPAVGDSPLFIPDGKNAVVVPAGGGESVVISTIPYGKFGACSSLSVNSPLWEDGKKLSAALGSQWLVLHHEPPGGGKVGGMAGNFDLTDRLLQAGPDYVLSGHLHGQPFFEGGGFHEKIGRSHCFNAGQTPPTKSRVPNYIILDTGKRLATWLYFDIAAGLFKEESKRLS